MSGSFHTKASISWRSSNETRNPVAAGLIDPVATARGTDYIGRVELYPGFFLLLLLLLLLVLLGGGFGRSTIFGFSFGGRLSLLFFCANAQAVTIVATSIAIRIRFSCFITALLLVFLTHANKGEAESCATAT